MYALLQMDIISGDVSRNKTISFGVADGVYATEFSRDSRERKIEIVIELVEGTSLSSLFGS